MEKTKFSMNRKQILLIAFSLLASANAMADDYRELVKQVVKENVSELNAIIGSLKKYLPEEEKDAEWYSSGKFEEYCSSKLPDDIVDLTLQCYRDNMAETQLKELVAQYKSQEVIEANKHLILATSQTIIDNARMQYDVITAVSKGNEPELPIAAQCSEEYKRKFEVYWGNCETEIVQKYSEMQRSFDGEKKAVLAKAVPYIVKGTKTVMLNNFIKSVTSKDLDAINRLSQSDASRARMNAVNCINSTHPKMLDEIKAHFEAWAKAQ